jgi:V8-like Glu-specific endopeptidase
MPRIAALLTGLSCCWVLPAQTIDPAGRVHPGAAPLASVPVHTVPAIDRLAIDNEDVLRRQQGLPARFAMPFAVSVDTDRHGAWEDLGGGWSLWRLRIAAPDASHVNLGFGKYELPATGRLMLYSSSYSHILRPFDSADQAPTGDLWTPVVQTAEIVVEVYVPTADTAEVRLRLDQVNAGYRFFGAGYTALPTDGSGTCNVDVACPQASAWANEIPAVAMITISGTSQCSGAMLNNTALDRRNYFLTANHCGVTAGAASSVVFYWNYEEPACGGTGAPLTQFSLGSTMRATLASSDFTLLELNAAPNPAWGITYAGWNRANVVATNATGIHHPSGDSKKISFELQATQLTNYGGTTTNTGGTYVRLIDWDTGVTEGGSSGSPLFDQNKRVIGQLSGGASACGNNLSDWYGKFASAWTGGGTAATRLSNWLDPLNTGATTLNTLVPIQAAVTSTGAGCYTRRASFAQTFAANTFDLDGTATVANTIEFVPTGPGYTVQQGSSAWFAPVAADLGLGNDALATVTLPFAFAFPGGSTNLAKVSSNGFVWLNGTSTDADATPSPLDLVNNPARFAPLWMDLNPAAGGSVHFDVDPSGNAVYVTWLAVRAAAAPTGGANSAQLVLHADGRAEFRYLAVAGQTVLCVTGWSPGVGLFPSVVDLSAALPLVTGIDLNPLTWSAVGRPITGTTQTVNLGSISNPASSIGLSLIGWSAQPAPLDLAVVGAGGCSLYVQVAVIEPFLVAGSVTPWSLPIPANPSLAGVEVFTQGGLLQNGVNALGLLTANSVKLTIGVF